MKKPLISPSTSVVWVKTAALYPCLWKIVTGQDRNYWQILYLLWVSASLSRVFEYSIRNSSSVRPRLGHSSPNQLCPWLVVVSHNRLTQTKDHKVEHWTVFGFGEGDKPGMTRRRPQSSPTTVTLPANDNIYQENLISFFSSLDIVLLKFILNILEYK